MLRGWVWGWLTTLFITLAQNSFNCVSKWMGPISGLASCREGIWTALLEGTECVCRVHQSLSWHGELNKLIGRLSTGLVTARGPAHSSTHILRNNIQLLKQQWMWSTFVNCFKGGFVPLLHKTHIFSLLFNLSKSLHHFIKTECLLDMRVKPVSGAHR